MNAPSEEVSEVIKEYTPSRKENGFRIPASGICNCGNRIDLTDDYYAACQCPICGQWWNLSGQELRPPHEWEEQLEPD